MGADQSTAANTQLRSQRDEDIPYTSYSISKPIDGVQRSQSTPEEDTPKSSPRLTSKTRSNSYKETIKDGSSTARSGIAHKIVVVAQGQGQTQQDSDPELQRIEAIPVFLPIMRASLNIPNLNLHDPDILDKLDTRQVLALCARYQEHLKQCSEAVAFDQNALCVRIKEIDFAIHTLYQQLTERQKKFAKYAEQIQKINEMNTVLHRVKMNVEQTVPLMDRLNSVLPPEDQLEPFSMKGK